MLANWPAITGFCGPVMTVLAGCVEVLSFPFVGDATFDALGLPAGPNSGITARLAR